MTRQITTHLIALTLLAACDAAKIAETQSPKTQDIDLSKIDRASVDTSEISKAEWFAENFLLASAKELSLAGVPDSETSDQFFTSLETLQNKESDHALLLQSATDLLNRFTALKDAYLKGETGTVIQLIAEDSNDLAEIVNAVMYGGKGYHNAFAANIAASDPLLVMDFFEYMITTLLKDHSHLHPPAYLPKLVQVHALQVIETYALEPQAVDFLATLEFRIDALNVLVNGLVKRTLPNGYKVRGRMALIASWLEIKAQWRPSARGAGSEILSSSKILSSTYTENNGLRPIRLATPTTDANHFALDGSPTSSRKAPIRRTVDPDGKDGTQGEQIAAPPRNKKGLKTDLKAAKAERTNLRLPHAKPALTTRLLAFLGNEDAKTIVNTYKNNKAAAKNAIADLKNKIRNFSEENFNSEMQAFTKKNNAPIPAPVVDQPGESSETLPAIGGGKLPQAARGGQTPGEPEESTGQPQAAQSQAGPLQTGGLGRPKNPNDPDGEADLNPDGADAAANSAAARRIEAGPPPSAGVFSPPSGAGLTPPSGNTQFGGASSAGAGAVGGGSGPGAPGP